MTAMLLAWTKFGVCAALIDFAGPALTHYGDIISQRTGVSRTWIGLILLATATSLPELITGISAVTVADSPNIAVGDALGSCVFNLLMLVILDALSRDEPVYRRIDQGHILTAGFGVILIGSAGARILLGGNGVGLQFLHISVYTPFIIVLYLVAIRAAFLYDRRTKPAQQITKNGSTVTLAAALMRYAGAAVVVAGAPPGVVFRARGLWAENRVIACRFTIKGRIQFNPGNEKAAQTWTVAGCYRGEEPLWLELVTNWPEMRQLQNQDRWKG